MKLFLELKLMLGCLTVFLLSVLLSCFEAIEFLFPFFFAVGAISIIGALVFFILSFMVYVDKYVE